MRIGHGYDAHRLVEGRRLVLGGVTVPFEKGLQGHSDGDVVIHALCDALLGAAGLGDIGSHFPDSSDKYRDIDSRVLLREVVSLLQGINMKIVNADVSIVAQSPRLSAHINSMIGLLADDLSVTTGAVNIKATTTEGMGFTGRGEGIAAYAVVLVDDEPDP
jgi:2-C-methyl-D-erythritol 2,4-cyclodiphosphate synthase